MCVLAEFTSSLLGNLINRTKALKKIIAVYNLKLQHSKSKFTKTVQNTLQ